MTDTNQPDDPDQPYRLPSPDMDVFGSDGGDHAGSETEAPTESDTSPGTMRFQDPSTTRPRPPTVAEQRARAQAEADEAEREREAEMAAARKALIRRRIMIGGGVTVGIAALVGAWYLMSPDNVTARCTIDGGASQDTVVQDQYCDESYVTSHGGYISNGIAFIPLRTGGYSQYHYYYGGSGSIGQRATGGSYQAPSNATVKTNTGKTISRGGFGVSGSHSGSSGGS